VTDAAQPEAALTAPAAARNRAPILAELRHILPATGTVLEIAAGTGEHALHFATALPQLRWQPSDPAPDSLASVEAWRQYAGPANLLAPLRLDASQPDTWPQQRFDAVLCINMIHIAPWAATEGLVRGAASCLGEGATLILYGPFLEDDVPTAASNAQFDADLRARNPHWGLRRREDLVALAGAHGFSSTARHALPANNLLLVFTRR